jgi:hypothetical protein
MKTSAIIFMPKNIQNRNTMYIIANNGRLKVVMPGSIAQLRIKTRMIVINEI